MSGGHWGYLSGKLEDLAYDDSPLVEKELLKLLAVIEHELDWGICSDSCYPCAQLRVPFAIEAFVDSITNEARSADASVAISLMRDSQQNCCKRCADRKDPGWSHKLSPLLKEGL